MTAVEVVAARVNTGLYSAIVVVIYRPGSEAVRSVFYDELTLVFEAIAVYQIPVFVVGDFNIRLDRLGDPNTRQLLDLIECFGFEASPTSATHQHGGTIDAVIVRRDISTPLVRPIDVGLFDHLVLEWHVNAGYSQPVTEATAVRSWRQMDIETLRSELLTSPICQLDVWPNNADQMADLFDSVIT